MDRMRESVHRIRSSSNSSCITKMVIGTIIMAVVIAVATSGVLVPGHPNSQIKGHAAGGAIARRRSYDDTSSDHYRRVESFKRQVASSRKWKVIVSFSAVFVAWAAAEVFCHPSISIVQNGFCRIFPANSIIRKLKISKKFNGAMDLPQGLETYFGNGYNPHIADPYILSENSQSGGDPGVRKPIFAMQYEDMSITAGFKTPDSCEVEWIGSTKASKMEHIIVNEETFRKYQRSCFEVNAQMALDIWALASRCKIVPATDKGLENISKGVDAVKAGVSDVKEGIRLLKAAAGEAKELAAGAQGRVQKSWDDRNSKVGKAMDGVMGETLHSVVKILPITQLAEAGAGVIVGVKDVKEEVKKIAAEVGELAKKAGDTISDAAGKLGEHAGELGEAVGGAADAAKTLGKVAGVHALVELGQKLGVKNWLKYSNSWETIQKHRSANNMRIKKTSMTSVLLNVKIAAVPNMKFHEGFASMVRDLPENYLPTDANIVTQFMKFFREFGTMVVTETKFGSQRISEDESIEIVHRSSTETNKKTDVNLLFGGKKKTETEKEADVHTDNGRNAEQSLSGSLTKVSDAMPVKYNLETIISVLLDASPAQKKQLKLSDNKMASLVLANIAYVKTLERQALL